MFGKTGDNSLRLGELRLGRGPVSGFLAMTAALCLLAGCVGTEEFASKASAAEIELDTKTVTVEGQDIILGKVDGYCFNDKQSRYSATGAFVVMGPCNPEDEGSNAKGLVTINVLSKSGMGDTIVESEMEAYFQSTAGRTALSRSGDPDKLEVLGTLSENGFVYVHTKDAGGPIIPDTTDELWRVFFVVSDRLVSVSVINFVDDLMPDGLVFSHMENIARRVQSLNTQ